MAPPQQLDPSASYKKKLAQYSLYHGRGNKETVEDIVGGSEPETDQVEVSDWLLLVWELQKIKECKSDAELTFFLLEQSVITN